MPRWIAYRRLHRTKQDREPKWTQEKTERTEKNKTVFKIPGWKKIEKGQKEKNVWRIEVACKINKNCAGENILKGTSEDPQEPQLRNGKASF